mmetsp:Transcript_7295/g.21551  ORF Transcript_7295/g.21551 Transcript_7295/m.21551 type:complete len:143 (-) Transcript_7295:510-938(-)
MGDRGASTVPFSTTLTDFDDALIKRDICSREQCLKAKGMTTEQLAGLLAAEEQERDAAAAVDAARDALEAAARDPLKAAVAAAETPDDLDELDEDDAFCDDAFLARYREQRLAELKGAGGPRFSGVLEIARADWTREARRGV